MKPPRRHDPSHGGLGALRLAFCLALASAESVHALVISEIHYHPSGPNQDARRLEFIELHNEQPDPLDLTGFRFTEGVDFVFEERTFLEGGAYLVVCADRARIRETYGIQNAVGNWLESTALANEGERVTVSGPGGLIAAMVRYGTRGGWPAAADGTGHTLSLVDPFRDLEDSGNWRSSLDCGGTPGAPNFPDPSVLDDLPPALINEGLIRTSGPRWVELFNPSAAPVDLSDYWLTDSRDQLARAKLPAGTTIAAGGWLVLEDGPLGLDFSYAPATRESVFVALVDREGSHVLDARAFEPAVDERSEALIPDGFGRMAAAADPTPGAANRVTVVGDVVIHEIHYHPMDGDPGREFVELFNRGETEVDLSGWGFVDGLSFRFPDGTRIPAGGYLVVARDPERIRGIYGLPGSAVVGPAQDPEALAAFGVLRDSGERISLADASGNIADTVRYGQGGEWADWPDGGGSTLELIDPWQDNDSPHAWDSSDDSTKAEARSFEYRGRQAAANPDLESEIHVLDLDRGIVLVDDLHIAGPAKTEVQVDVGYVPLGSMWRYLKGTAAPPAAWKDLDFADVGWSAGPAPLGYGDEGLGTILDDMRRIAPGSGYWSFYCRKSFDLVDPAQVDQLMLEIDFDDGYVAYLNGTEVARDNIAGVPPAFDAAATVGRNSGDPVVRNLTSRKGLLRAGRNVLAIELHNDKINSPDAFLEARLFSGKIVDVPAGWNMVPDGDFEAPPDAEWYIQGTHVESGRTSSGPLAGAGSLKVVASGGGDMKVNRIEREIPWGLTAGNDYTVSLKARWVVGSANLLTMGYNFGMAKAHALHVPENVGTPGAQNGVSLRQVQRVGSLNLGPVIDQVSQSPAQPAAYQTVRVSARIADPDGVASALLRWSQRSVLGPFTEIAMTGPDSRGAWKAEIAGKAAGTLVVWEIVAMDTGGRTGRYPADRTLRTHPLILDPAAPRPDARGWAIHRHGPLASGPFPHYQILMALENETYLNSRPVHADDYIPSTLVFADAQIHHGAGFRYQGSALSRSPNRNFRVELPGDDPLFGRVHKFNLDSDGLAARERLVNYIIRNNAALSRVAYLSHTYSTFSINGRSLGVREIKVPPAKEFVSRWFPEDDSGDLFELDERSVFDDGGRALNRKNARWLNPPYPGEGAPDDKEAYRHYFNTRMDKGLDDYSHLIATARVMDPARTPARDFDTLVFQHLDLEQMLRVLAVRQNTGDVDTWGCWFGRSAYLYRPEGDGLWRLAPWDMDISFSLDGRPVTFLPLPSDPTGKIENPFPEVERLLNRPACRRVYYRILKEMVDTHFGSGYLKPYLDLLRQVGATQESLAPGDPGGWIDQRAALIRGWIGGAVSPQKRLEITTNGGEDFLAEEAVVEIEGVAPVEIALVLALLDGKPIPDAPAAVFSTDDMFRWSVPAIALHSGENRVEVLGFSTVGDLIESDSIRITLGPGWFVRGDVDGDTQTLITDAVRILLYLFRGQDVRCLDACDVDDNGAVNLTDAVRLLNFLFMAGDPPPAPFPSAGQDPTLDELDCKDGS